MSQGEQIDRSGLGFCREQIIEQVHGVLPGQGGGVGGHGDALIELQRAVKGHLTGGVDAGKVAVIIAQQPQGHGNAFGQGDGVARAEGAVQIAGNQTALHRRLHIGGGPVGVGHVGIGRDQGLPAGAVLPCGHGQHHFGELRPGDGPGEHQVACAVSHHDIQGGQGGGGILLRGGRRQRTGKRSGEKRGGQQGRNQSLFHDTAPLQLISRTAGRLWG
ncbi:hypothetical protein SDC9_166236 [bioreactor metagenome]|uniref:Uncharacterized protein n=1 Tax=bioreactor metagenome TaxID=1076179 RepID=A0A645FWF0_9ZZZZ